MRDERMLFQAVFSMIHLWVTVLSFAAFLYHLRKLTEALDDDDVYEERRSDVPDWPWGIPGLHLRRAADELGQSDGHGSRTRPWYLGLQRRHRFGGGRWSIPNNEGHGMDDSVGPEE